MVKGHASFHAGFALGLKPEWYENEIEIQYFALWPTTCWLKDYDYASKENVSKPE